MAIAGRRLEGTLTLIFPSRYSGMITDDDGNRYFLAWKNMERSAGTTGLGVGARLSFYAAESDRKKDMPVAIEVRLLRPAMESRDF